MAGRQGRVTPRNPLRETKQQLTAVNRMIGRHVTMCYRCAHAGADTGRYCDTGWQLAKEQARINAAVRKATETAAGRPVQGELW